MNEFRTSMLCRDQVDWAYTLGLPLEVMTSWSKRRLIKQRVVTIHNSLALGSMNINRCAVLLSSNDIEFPNLQIEIGQIFSNSYQKRPKRLQTIILKHLNVFFEI